MTGADDQGPRPAGLGAGALVRRPAAWLALADLVAGVAALLRLQGPAASAPAVAAAGLALAALAGLAWTLGARNADDPASRLLRSAAEDSDDGLLLTDADGGFVYANLAFHRLFHMAAEPGGGGKVVSLEAIGRALAHDEAAAAEFRRLAANARAGVGGRAEFPVAAASSALEWRRLTVTALARPVTDPVTDPVTNPMTGPMTGPMTDQGGGTLWRVEDTTARREVDAVRREQEANLADYLDLLPVGFFSADATGRVLYANQTLGHWLGVAPEELVARPLADFLAADGPEAAAVPAGEGVARVTLRRADGGLLKAQVAQTARGGGSRDDRGDDRGDGRGDSGAGYSRAVVLPEANWHYRESGPEGAGEGRPEIRLHWLFDEAPVGIVLLDLDGNIAECNRAFLKLVGLHPEVLISQAFADRVAKEDRGEIATQLSKVVMGAARATHMEVRMPGAGKRELVTSVFASRLENALGELSGLALHFIDTTEQKNLEIQFAQSQKMQAVGQLAGGVAHDFNNLLTAMIGFSDLLLARHRPDDPDFADIQQIRQNANRATNLVRQLLAFSRQQNLAPMRLDVTEALNELSNLLGRLIGEKIDLVIEHGRDLAPVWVDKGQFDQVIINLAVNARDAMPGGGQLTVRTAAQALDAPVQRGHDLVPRGRYVAIEVADTGVGIQKEDMERIFDPFFSTKEVGAGTGLGLSTVYGIVHQTGGFIFVDSAPGEGTTFSLLLPEFAEETAAEAAEAAPVEAPADQDVDGADLTGAGTVLLVEDEDAVRMFAARALRNKGYHVLEADDGEAGLDVINGTEETIDLIISDVVMPGMDGHTLVRLVRHELPEVKVILMSGYAEDVFADEIERDPTIAFLAKPFSLKGLASKVKEVMAG